MADGSRTRKRAEHMMVCAETEDTPVSFSFVIFASKVCLEVFYFSEEKIMSVIFTLRWCGDGTQGNTVRI